MERNVTAILGPTNTGKTHLAVERLCAHSSGMMGFPLRLLAREVYDRIVAIKGPKEVALITGEERIAPDGARWLICTTESMPVDRDVAFVALDEAQLGADRERGHVFTDRLLHARGRDETMILGSETLKPLVRALVPDAEIVTRPRFSDLSFAGAKKLSRLPPRSAIVAFSAEEVYAIAELIRRTRGGAAIVMGALSPRTRNAQVAMFQSGEVDFLVATDAIGMGLNMDVGHVSFASLSKFDGQRQRRLTISEMAQIAGRAGRHQRDGTFGTVVGDGVNAFTEVEIDRIENHRFPPLDHLFWRDADPDVSSVDALIASLEAPPDRAELRAAPEATDLAVLKRLAEDPRPVMAGEVGRLWELCGLPDFRKVGPHFHAQLVSRLFGWLRCPDGRIPDDVLAGELARLDSIQGDVAAIAQRIATARTWAYAAQRADWVSDPAHWSDRAAALEERLSDALHEKLTQRFVDKRTRALAKGLGGAVGPVAVEFDSDGVVRVEGEAIGTLTGFDFQVDPQARVGERKRLIAAADHVLAGEIGRRAAALIAADDGELALANGAEAAPEILWRGTTIARLAKGERLTQPRVVGAAGLGKLAALTRSAVQTRLDTWLRRRLAQLAPLEALTQASHSVAVPAPLRATLGAIVAGHGHAARAGIEDKLRLLSSNDRRQLRKLGIVLGSLDLSHPALIKPAAVALLATLRAAQVGKPIGPLPMPGMGLLHRPSPALAAAARAAGYRAFGDQMVRIDLVERVARALHDQRQGADAFTPDLRLATSIGIGEETCARILRALGFRQASDAAQWRWRGLERPARRPARPLNPSFAALGDWKGAKS